MGSLRKGMITAVLLIAPAALIQSQSAFATTQKVQFEHQVNQESADLDVSQGWDVLEYSSDTLPDVNDAFKQGVETTGNEKCVLVQVGNIGDSTFTAQKVIPMKKGHQYDLDLIYAQFYDQEGTGSIDFNGETIVATNDSSDKEYKKTITPQEDMNYVITATFTTVYPGNAYFKLGYDKNGSGITDKPISFEAPVVSPAPEAGANQVLGTAYKGNTVVVSDSTGELGTGTVDEDGSFEVKTTRALRYKEELTILQKDSTQESPSTTVSVVDTITPEAPVLNKITDEDTEISGMAEPYSTVDVIFENGDPLPPSYSGIAESDGTFTIPLDQTYHGNTKITAIAIDEAGHKSPNRNGEVEFAHDLSVSLSHKISSADNIVSGTTSRSNCDITVHFGSRFYTGKSDDKGKFQIQIEPHDAGTDYTVEAVDPFDITKPASLSDKVLPRIPTFSTTAAGVQVLEGIVDSGAEVKVKLTRGSDDYDFTVTADGEGNFSIPLKDTEGTDLTLTIGDKLTYSATLNDIGLSSEEGSTTIFSF